MLIAFALSIERNGKANIYVKIRTFLVSNFLAPCQAFLPPNNLPSPSSCMFLMFNGSLYFIYSAIKGLGGLIYIPKGFQYCLGFSLRFTISHDLKLFELAFV